MLGSRVARKNNRGPVETRGPFLFQNGAMAPGINAGPTRATSGHDLGNRGLHRRAFRILQRQPQLLRERPRQVGDGRTFARAESGYLDQAGPLGRLFYREMETGTHQVVPFLRFYGASRARGEARTLGSARRRTSGELASGV